ncbi:MAG: nucleotidyltransferase family protein [Desulfobacterales bacterium]|nr:nucleotidyltransferase family protein [Desulfobacterales bacterium]
MNESRLNKNILSLISVLNSEGFLPDKNSAMQNWDWPAMAGAVEDAGMAGYFSDLLLQTEAGLEVPPAFAESIKNSARRIAAMNNFYKFECEKILKKLSDASIENVLLKGFSYMQDIYGNTVARRMSDIDLLIRPDDRTKVMEFLRADGYSEAVTPSFRGNQDDFYSLSDVKGEAHFINKIGALTVNIDLHWKFRANFPMNDYLALDRFPWWENCSTVLIGEMPARRLSPEMQFIHLALHFALHHQYTGLRWFVELGLFLRKFASVLDWEYINKTASSPDCRKLLGICLRLVTDYLGESWCASAIWRKFLPVSSLLPGEYRFYQSCLMKVSWSRFSKYICMLLSPATITGRFKLISYFFFDSEGIVMWHGSDRKVPKWIQPFYSLYIVGCQLLRGKRH